MKIKILITLLFLLFGTASFAEDIIKPMPPGECLKCHENKISSHNYFQSVHKDLACTACHVTDNVFKPKSSVLKKQCVVSFKSIDCARCHAKIATEYKSSVHNGARLPVTCSKCHSDIHAIQSHKSNKVAIAAKCIECHSQQNIYFKSQHYKALLEGKNDSATCTDCHGLHAIAKIDNTSKGRIFHTKACLQCHDDKEKMKRNDVTTIAGDTYFSSFHGKNVRLGYPEKVAGCADCHTAHSINKADNKLSSIHPDNIVNTCKQCHSNATESFAKYIPHAEDTDKHKFAALYWTRIAMTGLLIGTFLFFWIHSMLWAFRAFIERHQKNKAAALADENGEVQPHKIKNAKKIYRRFKTRDIILHLMVVVSFLGLSLTGLPLKFSGTSWGKAIFDFIGGAERARLIHHICAIITFIYFTIAIALGGKFLFTDKKQKGNFLDKLFGPDSLFPNMRDLRDLKAMFKWFFFLGAKPTFERWAYWEKFDFMAVFWGMFVIGSSGLMLWFPEFFGNFLPGWAFNIATIVHSDEALLATGFIFTVHFFNTHFRPEKFPMDTVIFNGQISKEEMMEERGDQWKRYEEAGITEEFAVKKPRSVFWDMGLRIFGFLAVIIGLSLFIGMITAMLSH